MNNPNITPASAAVIRGGFFASAKKMTLITVSWMRLLNEAAPAAENPIISIKL